MTHFNWNPTDDYLAAVQSIKDLAPEHGTPVDAYADAVATRAKEQWAEKRGWEEISPECINALWGEACNRPVMSHECTPPGGDHESMWAKDGFPVALVSQPYGLTWPTIQALTAYCVTRGLEWTVDAWPAWHYPGAVVFVTVTRVKGAERTVDGAPWFGNFAESEDPE